jgi:archaellin
MWNRAILVAALIIAAVAVASAGQAQEQAANPPQSTRAQSGNLVAVKVQVVISRYQGDKKISSLPYVLGVVVNLSKTSLRMGVDVPVVQTVFSSPSKDGPATVPSSSYSYRSVGTNIDCTAENGPGDAFKLALTVQDSSVQLDPAERGKGLEPNVPMFRSFNSSFQILLRDGQSTQYTSATDPISGEVTKIDVTLNVLK